MDEQVGRVRRVLFRLPVGASRGSLVTSLMSRTLKEARWDDTSRTPSSRLVQGLLACALSWSMLIIGSQRAAAVKATAPNIVIVLTDDQRFDSLFSMRHVRGALAGKGLTFDRAFVSNSLCCPSRASILTRAGCRTRRRCIRTSTGDGPRTEAGGHCRFLAHDEQGTIALALHDAGYRTGIFGKYFNGFPQASSSQAGTRWASSRIAHGRALLPLFPLREEQERRRTSNVTGPPRRTTRRRSSLIRRWDSCEVQHQDIRSSSTSRHSRPTPRSCRRLGTSVLGPTTGLIFGRASTRATSRTNLATSGNDRGSPSGRSNDGCRRPTSRCSAVDRMVGRLTSYLALLEAAVQHDDRLHCRTTASSSVNTVGITSSTLTKRRSVFP